VTAPVTAPRDRVLGDFQLLAKLATGGMAEIFLARRLGAGPDQPVQVVKRILPHLADDEHFVAMFRDEAALASQLVHPNICRVHHLGIADGGAFIVMEYLHGVALSRLLSRLSKRRQFLDVRVVAGLAVQACDGLHAAHEARGRDGHPLGVVHRDVSPPNILVTGDGVVKLLDFGIAKARGASSKTRTGTVKGKNAYMSPEQILGKPLDRRSDVFALAAVVYELLSVRRLFHRDSDFLTFKAITEEPIPDIRDRRSDLPAALVGVLTRALARDPNARFATAAAMAAAITSSVASLGGPATADELRAALGQDFAEELLSKEALLVQAEQVAAGAPPLAIPSSGAVATPPEGSPHRRLEADFDRTPVARGARTPPPIPGASASVVVAPEAQGAGLVPARVGAARIGGAGIGGAGIGGAGISGTGSSGTGSSGGGALPGMAAAASGASTSGLHLPHSNAFAPGLPAPPSVGSPAAPPGLGPPAAPAAPSGLGPPAAPAAPSGFGAPSSFAAPTGITMVELADPGTDLLRDWRRRRLWTFAGFGVILALALAAFVIMSDRSSPAPGSGEDGLVAPSADAGTGQPVDAAPIDAPVDADPTRADIVALARYGFFSVGSDRAAEISIDHKIVGTAPLIRYPLTPGPHDIKAVSRGKAKRWQIMIEATKDVDLGVIEWGPSR